MHRLQINWLSKFGSVPFSEDALCELLSDYDDPGKKIVRMVQDGSLIRLRRGVYCVEPHDSRSLLQPGVIANSLYGPSYVSFETALAHYGLIPERVYAVTSAVARRSKSFRTPIGAYYYHHVEDALFPVGLKVIETEGGNYIIASPTKALCDTLMRKRDLRVTSPKTLRSFMEEDMRFDFECLGEPDREVVRAFVSHGVKVGLFKALERMFA